VLTSVYWSCGLSMRMHSVNVFTSIPFPAQTLQTYVVHSLNAYEIFKTWNRLNSLCFKTLDCPTWDKNRWVETFLYYVCLFFLELDAVLLKICTGWKHSNWKILITRTVFASICICTKSLYSCFNIVWPCFIDQF